MKYHNIVDIKIDFDYQRNFLQFFLGVIRLCMNFKLLAKQFYSLLRTSKGSLIFRVVTGHIWVSPVLPSSNESIFLRRTVPEKILFNIYNLSLI